MSLLTLFGAGAPATPGGFSFPVPFLIGFGAPATTVGTVTVDRWAPSYPATPPRRAGRQQSQSVAFVPIPPAFASLSATLGDVTLTGTVTSTAPTNSNATLSATLADVTLAGVASSSEVIYADKWLPAYPSRLQPRITRAQSAGIVNVLIPPTGAALAGTLGDVTLVGAATSSAPGTATGTLSATLADVTLSATATSVEVVTADKWQPSYPARLPGRRRPQQYQSLAFVATVTPSTDSNATLSSTIDDVTLTGTAHRGVILPSDGTVSVTLGAVTLSGAATSVPPIVYADKWLPTYPNRLQPRVSRSRVPFLAFVPIPGSAATLSSVLDAVTLTGTATSVAPTPSNGTLSATLGDVTLVGVATSIEAIRADKWLPTYPVRLQPRVSRNRVQTSAVVPIPPSGVTLAVTLGDVTLAGIATSTAPGASAATLSITTDDVTLTGVATSVAPGASNGTLSATLADVTISGVATSSAAGNAAGTLSATLGSVTLTGVATSVAPTPSAGTLSATLGDVTVSGIATVASSTLSYAIYCGDTSGGPVDYSTPVATTPGLVYVAAPQSAGTIRRWAVRATDISTGLEEKNTDATVTLVIDALGADVSDVPRAPTFPTATASGSTGAVVTWNYLQPPGPTSPPTGFKVWATVGGVVNYAASPVADVPYVAGLSAYRVTLSGLTASTTYAIGIRAYNASGTEANVSATSLTTAGTPPAAVDDLTGTAI